MNGMKKELRFGEDGKFRILHVADIQDGPFLIPIVKTFIKCVTEITRPDLIVLGGDNIAGYACRTKGGRYDARLAEIAINNFMAYFEKKKIPVAFVFGNHDAECAASREKQLEFYKKYACALTDGLICSEDGVYSFVPIGSSSGEKTSFGIWLFDTAVRGKNGGYGHVGSSQLEWYKRVSAENRMKNGRLPLPSLAFQHVPFPETTDFLIKNENGPKCGYSLDEKTTRAGVLHETPEVSRENGGQFEAMKECDDIAAVFFAHDHVNTYEITPHLGTYGFDIVATPGITFNSYGDETRGSRLIVLDENAPGEYDTKVYYMTEVFSKGIKKARFKATWAVHDLLESAGRKINELKKE